VTRPQRELLLDTHTLLWLVSDAELVSPTAREVLADRDCALWVSAGSAWEIATKTRLGRLDGEPLLSAWAMIMADLAATELPIDTQDAIAAGTLRWEHRDPFDRLLVAQATRRNLTIATRDERILGAGLASSMAV